MARKKNPQKVEREYRDRLRVEHKVLDELKGNGPLPWNGLYVHFERETPDIGKLLHGLREYGYIQRDKADMTSITDSGLKLLQDSTHWL